MRVVLIQVALAVALLGPTVSRAADDPRKTPNSHERMALLAQRGPENGGTGVGGLLKVVQPQVERLARRAHITWFNEKGDSLTPAQRKAAGIAYHLRRVNPLLDQGDSLVNDMVWLASHDMRYRVPGIEELSQHLRARVRVAQLAEGVIADWKRLKNPPGKLRISVQDFQEALAVDVLRRRVSQALPGVALDIAFQLHIPWRTFRATEPVLLLLQRALLEADIIAFQHADHVDAFVAHAEEGLGYARRRSDLGGYQIQVPPRDGKGPGRWPLLMENPVGISGDEFLTISRTPEFEKAFERFVGRYKGRVVFEMGGRVDMTKGWNEFLDAAELALEQNPSLKDKVAFVLATAPTREDRDDYRTLYHEVVNRAGALVDKYPNTFVLHEKGLPYKQFMALHAAADVILLPSPNGEGMGLPPLEATAMAHLKGRAVVPLVSRKATVGRYLAGSVRIDTKNIDEFAQAIVDVAQMPAAKRRQIQQENLQIAQGRGLLYWEGTQSNFISSPFELLDASR